VILRLLTLPAPFDIQLAGITAFVRYLAVLTRCKQKRRAN
jgi:hypothetical protein